MRLYIKQIKPMIYSPATQGFPDVYIPYYNSDVWYPEDSKAELVQSLEPKIKAQDSWASLKFEERYAEVSLDTIKIGNDDTIVVTLDTDLIDVCIANEIINLLKEEFSNSIVGKFKGMDIEIRHEKH